MYANPVLAAAMPLNKVSTVRTHKFINDQGEEIEEEIIDDIKKSARYRERVIDSRFAFENNGRNVLLMLGIDGFAPYDKSVANMWPIIFQVYNLPAELRTKYYNFILAGAIGCHPKNLQTYMEIVVDELCSLYDNGMVVCDAANNNEEVTIKVMLLGSKADYPARSSLNCQKTHASYSGCHVCDILGYHACGTKKFDVHGPGTTIKTHHGLKAAASRLVQDKQAGTYKKDQKDPADRLFAHKTYMGMTAYPALFRLPYEYDIVLDSFLDLMHVMEGVIDRVIFAILKPVAERAGAEDDRGSRWPLTIHQQSLADNLCSEIRAPGRISPANQQPFNRSGPNVHMPVIFCCVFQFRLLIIVS